jgi:bifunctional non-homologous end joining protein LigD
MRRSSKAGKTLVDPASLPGTRPGRLPKTLELQLPERAASVPPGNQWLHEKKLEGYRLLARVADDGVRLFDGDRGWRLPPLERALARLPVKAALFDGQLATLQADGTSSLGQFRRAVAAGQLSRLVFHAFDLLHLDGYDLTDVELAQRKRALRAVVTKGGAVSNRGPLRYLHHFEGNGTELYADVCRLGLAGLVSRLRTSRYRGGRSAEWLEIDCRDRAAVASDTPTQALARPRLASLGKLRTPAQARTERTSER